MRPCRTLAAYASVSSRVSAASDGVIDTGRRMLRSAMRDFWSCDSARRRDSAPDSSVSSAGVSFHAKVDSGLRVAKLALEH